MKHLKVLRSSASALLPLPVPWTSPHLARFETLPIEIFDTYQDYSGSRAQRLSTLVTKAADRLPNLQQIDGAAFTEAEAYDFMLWWPKLMPRARKLLTRCVRGMLKPVAFASALCKDFSSLQTALRLTTDVPDDGASIWFDVLLDSCLFNGDKAVQFAEAFALHFLMHPNLQNNRARVTALMERLVNARADLSEYPNPIVALFKQIHERDGRLEEMYCMCNSWLPMVTINTSSSCFKCYQVSHFAWLHYFFFKNGRRHQPT
jgi:hypothetical protein